MNSQTKNPPAPRKSMDDVQRDLEQIQSEAERLAAVWARYLEAKTRESKETAPPKLEVAA